MHEPEGGSSIGSSAERPGHHGSPGETFAAALRLGLTSFGGPIAHLGYFRNEYVVRRRWLDDQAYSELVGLCQFLPGPASSQVGFAVGWTRAGLPGALAAWAGFTLPSAISMFAFAMAARSLRGPLADAAFQGLKIAAVAVVAQAIIGMGRALTPDVRRLALALVAGSLMLLIANPAAQVGLIVLGAAAGAIIGEPGRAPAQERAGRAPGARLGLAAFGLFALLLLGLPLLAPTSSWIALASAFYRSGALVFGGGHVVLPLLRQGLVPRFTSDSRFLAGYGAAQAVPGPLFSIASYLGAIAVPAAPAAGSAISLVAIFIPGLLLVTGALAFRRQIVGNAIARRAIAGVNAVVVGLLAAAFCNPLWASGIANASDIVIAAIAFLLLVRLKSPPVIAVAFCLAARIGLAL